MGTRIGRGRDDELNRVAAQLARRMAILALGISEIMSIGAKNTGRK